MKILCFALLFIFWSASFGKTIKGKIDSVDVGKHGGAHLILMEQGEVVFLEFDKRFKLEDLKKAMENNEYLQLKVDSENQLQSFDVIDRHIPRFSPITIKSDPYTPAVVTLNEATNIFRRMRRDYKNKSQCFNRAHIWTFEEFTKKQTNLSKVFLFFTSRYIRKYKFKWWFHVTPMVYVGGTRDTNIKILDRRYTKGPIRTLTWTNIFIKSKKACKIVTKYSDYREHQKERDCYMYPTSMFYVVPSDLNNLEQTGTEKTEYDSEEVSYALWEAFGKEYQE